MNKLKKITNYRIAYVFSEVAVESEDKEQKYLLPFDGDGIPMEYEVLKELSENLKSFLEKEKKKIMRIFIEKE